MADAENTLWRTQRAAAAVSDRTAYQRLRMTISPIKASSANTKKRIESTNLLLPQFATISLPRCAWWRILQSTRAGSVLESWCCYARLTDIRRCCGVQRLGVLQVIWSVAGNQNPSHYKNGTHGTRSQPCSNSPQAIRRYNSSSLSRGSLQKSAVLGRCACGD